MARPLTTTAPDGASDAGTMVLVVLLAALVPTGCVLWFLNEAIENQQLAVQQRLSDVYRAHFDTYKGNVVESWRRVEQKLEQAAKLDDPKAVYELLVAGKVCNAVVVYDKSGRVVFPRQRSPFPLSDPGSDPFWETARRLEDQRDDGAIEVYEHIAVLSKNVHLAARAMQAQIRCLIRAGKIDDAIHVIIGQLSEPKYRDAMDTGGRLIAPAAHLLALQIGGEKLSPEFAERLIAQLTERLWDPNDAVMPAAQRLFLAAALRSLRPKAVTVKPGGDEPMKAYLLDQAQACAEEYLADDGPDAAAELSPTGLEEIWSLASPDKRIVALFTHAKLDRIIQDVCDALPRPPGSVTTARYNPSDDISPNAFISEPVGEEMPGWRMSIFLQKPDPFQAAADKQRIVYLITAGVAIALITVLAGAVARHLRRQTKLTRLKNDLIATVSHELKTPLASMRVLIDTLVDGRLDDQSQADEYLQLIARENLRLSRLIDNFLTFSRMERNKCAFEFAELRTNELIDEALASAGERFTGDGGCLEVTVEPDLPPIAGDSDALVTVILNLLDNAWKYSGDDREIRLKVFYRERAVWIKVKDNGIGMSPRTVRRIFARFYQADRALTSSGGCGLGLSIVKFILDAHGAAIEVVARVDSGSTFIVKIPARKSRNGTEK